uniref:Uncharacterized protein n=1 Tax=Chenopodium quinoa TaxID=63459 RepID=A0A803L9D2_CHEQI
MSSVYGIPSVPSVHCDDMCVSDDDMGSMGDEGDGGREIIEDDAAFIDEGAAIHTEAEYSAGMSRHDPPSHNQAAAGTASSAAERAGSTVRAGRGEQLALDQPQHEDSSSAPSHSEQQHHAQPHVDSFEQSEVSSEMAKGKRVKFPSVIFNSKAIADVDLNKCEPWDLPGRSIDRQPAHVPKQKTSANGGCCTIRGEQPEKELEEKRMAYWRRTSEFNDGGWDLMSKFRGRSKRKEELGIRVTSFDFFLWVMNVRPST